ncbi:MAG: hypothetical protein K0R10_2167 [Alphaproteobacteria bacterium]|jgi:hypothetical protein|nr:hypothetical protein [Alphaproteobacteria bacterium]
MTIHADVITALSSVLDNSWAVELPSNPIWPAIVFDVDTTPEARWVLGGGYDQHVIAVVILAKARTEIAALRPQIEAALQAIPGYMSDEESGDADYEADPSVYAYFMNFRIRTPH